MLHRLLAAAHGSGGFTVSDMTTLGWINVKDSGATGNGSTDDTAAVTAAIAALPSTGGVLYFPPGTYKTSGGFTLSNPVTVLGMGGGGIGGSGTYSTVSKITCTSATAVLFTVSSPNVIFSGLELHNTAGSTPSAGAGIATATSGTSSGDNLRILDCLVWGFYDGIKVTNGFSWRMSGTHVQNFVHRGLIARNDNVSDGTGGDYTVDSCWFMAGARSAATCQAINLNGGSGARLSKIEVNGDSGAFVDYGIVLQPTNGLSGFLDPWLISDCVLVGIATTAIYIGATGTNVHRVLISNTHMNPGWGGTTAGQCLTVDGTSGTISDILVSNCTLNAETTDSGAAIGLTSVDHVRITGCLSRNYGSLNTSSSCTDVVVTASA